MKHDTNSFQEDFTTLSIPLYSKIIRSKLNMLVNSERVLSMLDGGAIGHNRVFASQPLEPSDGCFALRKLMADGSNGFDVYLDFGVY
jgi:hypothetical protein